MAPRQKRSKVATEPAIPAPKPLCFEITHVGAMSTFNAALTGICANPAFFGPIMQQSPAAAVDFANEVVAEVHKRLGGQK